MASKAERYQLARDSVLLDLGADGADGAGQAYSDYAVLLEILPDAIIVHLDDGHIVYANATGANLFGAAGPDDLIGRLSSTLVPPETSEAVQKICQVVLRTGETSEFDSLFLARLDEKRIEVSGQCGPFIWNGSGALITIYRNLSAQKKVEEDFQMRLQDLEMNKLLLERSGSEYAALAE